MLRRGSARAPKSFPPTSHWGTHTALLAPGGGQSTQLSPLQLKPLRTRWHSHAALGGYALWRCEFCDFCWTGQTQAGGESRHLASPLQRPWREATRYDAKAFIRRNWLELLLQGPQSCWHGLWLHTTRAPKRIALDIKGWLNLLELQKFLACSETMHGVQRLQGVVVGTCLECAGNSRTKW